MARPCDDALRWRVIEAIRGGMSTQAAARRSAVGESTAGEWMRAYRTRGQVRPKPMGGRRGSERDPHADFMFDLIETSVGRDVRLDEIVARPAAGRGVTACRALVGRYLLVRGMTLKKTAHAAGRNRPDVRAAREAGFDARPDLHPGRLIFIDETGADTKMARLRGRAPRS